MNIIPSILIEIFLMPIIDIIYYLIKSDSNNE